MNTLGVILARAGSVGLPSKHLLPLLGRPMISYTFAHANAAMRLAQLRWDRGHRADARRILGDVLAWFTEGSETVDLRDARRLSEAFARES